MHKIKICNISNPPCNLIVIIITISISRSFIYNNSVTLKLFLLKIQTD